MSDPEPTPSSPTLHLDLGNLAEVNLVAINPLHITHVRLMGTRRQASRKMEVHLVSGSTVGVNFDEDTEADGMFAKIAAAMHGVIFTEPDASEDDPEASGTTDDANDDPRGV